jgi:predicted ATPase
VIHSLHISGFKLFHDIALPRLGRLNLFVGENNTGKSCLLEAISLYTGRLPAADVIRIASERSSERLRPWDIDGITEEGPSLIHPVFDLFRRNGNGVENQIVIRKRDDANPLRLQHRLQRLTRGDDGIRRYEPVAPGDVTTEGVEMAIEVYRGKKRVALITRRSFEMPFRTSSLEKLANPDASAVAFLPARGFSEEGAASIWDSIVQGPGQELVLEWLRMIDPRIEDLTFISGTARSRVPLLKMQGRGRIPLRSMGDGMTRMFHIALAVGAAQGGVLLIDEFENGLHWRIQEKLWNALDQAGHNADVQIFCTTHSRDCIEGFTAAALTAKRPDAFVYRLERISEQIFATELPIGNVGAAMREHAEVR